MFVRVFWILGGFVLASFAAATTLVMFVYAPSSLETLSADLSDMRLMEAGGFALWSTLWVAVSVAPALALVVYAEIRRCSGWKFYVLLGLGTALAGFLLQHLCEPQGVPGIFEAYALLAFLAAGIIGGLVYWLASGRYAGRPWIRRTSGTGSEAKQPSS
jgi:hypothetical protein